MPHTGFACPASLPMDDSFRRLLCGRFVFYCSVMTMKTDSNAGLEDRLTGDLPFEVFQERSPTDLAVQIRFLYREVQSRLAVRDRAVESLLQQECEIETRLHEIERPFSWVDETAQKERMQLSQELRDIGKQRRDVYESAATDLLRIKQDLMEALLEYRSLRRRQKAFGRLLADDMPRRLGAGAGPADYALPALPQYLAPEEQDRGKQEGTPAPDKKSARDQGSSGDDNRV